jgi:hypothetical protein
METENSAGWNNPTSGPYKHHVNLAGPACNKQLDFFKFRSRPKPVNLNALEQNPDMYSTWYIILKTNTQITNS